ncbi:hypothetical protein G7Z17_g10216 [Cylindrodendrum hubeiense]|uniref:Uncharacterized protein n=1 Tax=Cylindrodendrum hubeiense TaxID=595255 RepID=A0A9P5LCW1_9HYPO|nr:hypothetical protein G7Z17_g10216 [Cylindrodendrum hubeiense]
MATLAIDTADALRQEFSFLSYSPHQDAIQEQITVKRTAHWSYCGPLLRPSPSDPDLPLPPNFYDFAAATFTGPLLPRLLPFLEFVNAVLEASGLGHYLLTVRATTPTHEFDRPRWHTDELFFSDLTRGNLPGTRLGLKSHYERKNSPHADLGTNWKICTTLLGPSTLFIPLEHQSSTRETQRNAREAASTDHVCLSIRCVGCSSAADSVREELATSLAQFNVKAAAAGECALFRVGRESGAMHSEPCMSESPQGRVFINVVPGTEEELSGTMKKWGMEFPRQWWIGGYAV